MSDLEKWSGEALEPYEPGIERDELKGAVLSRFLPASLVSVLAVFAFLIGFPLSEFIFVPVMLAPLVAGFSAGLELLRRRLYPDADLKGRRTVLAGLLAPLTAFVALAINPSIDLLPAMGIFGLIGVLMAFVMFFAWLTPTPEELRRPGWIAAESVRPSDDSDADDPVGRLDLSLLKRRIRLGTPRSRNTRLDSAELAAGIS